MCYVLGCETDPIVSIKYQDNLVKIHTEHRCENCARETFNSDKKILKVEALDETKWAQVEDSVRGCGSDDDTNMWEDYKQTHGISMGSYSGDLDSFKFQ